VTPVSGYTFEWYEDGTRLDEAPKDAGEYELAIFVPETDGEYIGSEVVNFTIEKAMITIQADNKTAHAGDVMPELTYTSIGLAEGESLQMEPTLTCVADMDEGGEYAILVSGAQAPDADNYNQDVEYQEGKLTVTAKASSNSNPLSDPSDSHGSDDSESSSYQIIVEDAEGGTVKADKTYASSGETVTLTITPDTGFQLESLTAKGRSGKALTLTERDGQYTFQMPNANVTVSAVFVEIETPHICPSAAFRDLDTEKWYHEALDFVIGNNLMGGYGDGKFGPDDNLSRAQLAQILYNQVGKPAVTDASVFDDVTSGAWYADAIAWVAQTGIVLGYGNGAFGPDDSITREQLAAMLWRGVGSPAATQETLPLTDADQVSGYAQQAMLWAVETGILSGKGGGVLDPQGPATRAEVAQMIKNLMDSSHKN
jgi:hypothetical protein